MYSRQIIAYKILIHSSPVNKYTKTMNSYKPGNMATKLFIG